MGTIVMLKSNTMAVIGSTLARGVEKAVAERGFLGAFTGGLTASAGGIAAAIFFGYLAAVIFKPKEKK